MMCWLACQQYNMAWLVGLERAQGMTARLSSHYEYVLELSLVRDSEGHGCCRPPWTRCKPQPHYPCR
eukprot:COSAG01_NODE_13819_length_1530_cov_3.316562_1_plen_66_part_10